LCPAEASRPYNQEASFESLLSFERETSFPASNAGSETSQASKASRRSLRDLADLRVRHKRVLKKLSNGSRAAAVARACRQTAPAPSSQDGFLNKPGDDSSQGLQELFLPQIAADPLVAAVNGIGLRHEHQIAQIHVKLRELRQDLDRHRNELSQTVRGHSGAIAAARPASWHPWLEVFTAVASAFSFTYTVVLVLNSVAVWKPGHGMAQAMPWPLLPMRAAQALPPWQLSERAILDQLARPHLRQRRRQRSSLRTQK